MAWVTIAEGTSPDNMRATEAGKGKKVPHGEPLDIIITLPAWLPAGAVFDSFLGEELAQRLHQQTGAVVRDVESTGYHTVVMHCEANFFAVTAGTLAALAAILFGVGFLIAAIRVEAPEDLLKPLADVVKWVAIGLIALAAIAGLFLLSRSEAATALQGALESA